MSRRQTFSNRLYKVCRHKFVNSQTQKYVIWQSGSLLQSRVVNMKRKATDPPSPRSATRPFTSSHVANGPLTINRRSKMSASLVDCTADSNASYLSRESKSRMNLNISWVYSYPHSSYIEAKRLTQSPLRILGVGSTAGSRLDATSKQAPLVTENFFRDENRVQAELNLVKRCGLFQVTQPV